MNEWPKGAGFPMLTRKNGARLLLGKPIGQGGAHAARILDQPAKPSSGEDLGEGADQKESRDIGSP